MPLIVSDLWIYPVKSTMGYRVSEARVERRGLAGDRRWMLVDEHGKMITQRECGALQSVATRLQDGDVWAHCTGRSPLKLSATTERRTVTIWGESVSAVVADELAQTWFTQVLGRTAIPVTMDEHSERAVDPNYAKDGDEVSFADGFPLLLIGEGSLAELNRRLDKPIDMRRFRPNIVVQGAEPFAEDRWQRIRINDIEFELVKPCSRCVLTTRDPDNGELDGEREPLRTLATFRRQTGGVMFGQNVIARGEGILHQHASITIID